MATNGSADVQVVPGPEATWTGQKTQGIVASRTHTVVYPKAGGVFTQGNKIRLEIPSQDYWDMSLFSISFRTKLFGGPGRKDAFNARDTNPPTIYGGEQPGSEPTTAINSRWLTTKNGIQSLFNRVRILQGSTVIADVQEYGKLNRLLRLTSTTPDHQKQIDFMNEGVYDPENWEQKKAARNFFSSANADSNEGHYFNVRINTGFLEVDKYFPTKYTGQITFEIYMETNQNCLRSSRTGTFSTGDMPSIPVAIGAANALTNPTAVETLDYPDPSYQVDEVQAHVHFVIPIQEYDEEMLSSIEGQGLTIMYNTWSEHTRQINSTGKSVHSFQERAVSVRGGLAVMENEHDLGGVENEWQFSANNIEEFQWKLGNTYVPAQPVLCKNGPSRALAELEDFLNISGDPTASWLIGNQSFLDTPETKATANVIGRTGIDGTALKTWDQHSEMRYGNTLPNHFIMALNLEKSPGQLSGFNTSATNVDIELRTTLVAQNTLTGQYGVTDRGNGGNTTFITNQGDHTFQPSKFVCQDRTQADADGYYTGIQPTNKVLSGEGHGLFHYASEDAYRPAVAAQAGGAATVAQVESAGIALGVKPINRFPGTVYGGGVTSTNFLYTKPKHEYSLLTFWANVDAQVNIIRVGQMEVLR